MKYIAAEQPVVPSELQGELDGSVLTVYEEWAHKSRDNVVEEFEDSKLHAQGDKTIRYAELAPRSGDPDPEQTGVMVLPAGKTWNLETYTTAQITRELMLPAGRLIVFPNNNNGQRSYSLDKSERAQVAQGDLSPLSERQLRVCSALGIDTVALVIGHSFGATGGAAFASWANNYLQIHANAYDEAPNSFMDKDRTALELRKSMMRERELVKPAINDIGLPALNEITGVNHGIGFSLALARYAIGANTIAPNREINRSFLTDSLYQDISELLATSETATVFATNAASSTVCDIDSMAAFAQTAKGHFADDERVSHMTYEGYHVTGSNPFVLGLIGRSALDWHSSVEIAGRDVGSISERQTQVILDSNQE